MRRAPGRDALRSSGVGMQVRRIVTVCALALGLPLLMIGSGAGPATVDTAVSPAERQVRTVAPAAKTPEAVAQTTLRPRSVRVTSSPQPTIRRVDLARYDIPVTALLAYKRAAGLMRAAKPSCDLSWPLLAAIGRVESDHGRYAGAKLEPDGVSTPRVIGVALDGHGPVAAIPDSDEGRWDGDTTWDRAVGPMQFLPSTWSLVGVDADGDGVRSIDDIDDAALGAGIYLCAGAEQGLASESAMEQAVLRYNNSEGYLAVVMAFESKYSGGDFEVLTPSDGATDSARVLAGKPLTGIATGVPGKPRAGVTKRADAAARHAIVRTRKHHATRIQAPRPAGPAVGVTTRTATTAGKGGHPSTPSGKPGENTGSPSTGSEKSASGTRGAGPATGGTGTTSASTSPDTTGASKNPSGTSDSPTGSTPSTSSSDDRTDTSNGPSETSPSATDPSTSPSDGPSGTYEGSTGAASDSHSSDSPSGSTPSTSSSDDPSGTADWTPSTSTSDSQAGTPNGPSKTSPSTTNPSKSPSDTSDAPSGGTSDSQAGTPDDPSDTSRDHSSSTPSTSTSDGPTDTSPSTIETSPSTSDPSDGPSGTTDGSTGAASRSGTSDSQAGTSHGPSGSAGSTGAASGDAASESPSGTPTPTDPPTEPTTPKRPEPATPKRSEAAVPTGSEAGTPTPTPTPATIAVVAVLGGGRDAYTLEGMTLVLGSGGASLAEDDIDGDGAIESNANELAGLRREPVRVVGLKRGQEETMVVVSTVNGVALG